MHNSTIECADMPIAWQTNAITSALIIRPTEDPRVVKPPPEDTPIRSTPRPTMEEITFNQRSNLITNIIIRRLHLTIRHLRHTSIPTLIFSRRDRCIRELAPIIVFSRITVVADTHSHSMPASSGRQIEENHPRRRICVIPQHRALKC